MPVNPGRLCHHHGRPCISRPAPWPGDPGFGLSFRTAKPDRAASPEGKDLGLVILNEVKDLAPKAVQIQSRDPSGEKHAVRMTNPPLFLRDDRGLSS